MEDSNQNFVKMDIEESFSKLSSHFKAKGELKVWKKGETFKLISLKDVKSKEKQFIIKEPFPQGTTIFFSFQMTTGLFFGKGLVRLVRPDGEIVVELLERLFKYEKRKDERLLSYPHYLVFVYFRLFHGKDAANVVSINRPTGTKINMFKRFEDSIHAKESLGEDVDGLIGFRVLDLSLGGISFVANNLEKDFFKKETKYEECILDFNGKKIFLGSGEVLYNINYIDPKARRVQLYKIGYKFNEDNMMVSDLLNKFLDSSEEDTVGTEFEKFFGDNED